MKIYFDNEEFQVENEDENIVQVAQKNGVHITAPCYKNKRKLGCCGVCVINVDNTDVYACTTKPFDGMNIVYNNEKLNILRKERLKKYSENIKNENLDGNSCSSCSSTEGKNNNSSCVCDSKKENCCGL